jgi:signal transduction histidine kinase
VSGSAVRDHKDVPLRTLVDDVLRRVPAGVTVTLDVAPAADQAVLSSADPAALADACASFVGAMTRTRSHVRLVVKATGDGIEIAIGAPDGTLDDAAEPRPLNLGESGVGLSLLVAAAVVEAHGGRVWQSVSPPALGMTLRGSNQP